MALYFIVYKQLVVEAQGSCCFMVSNVGSELSCVSSIIMVIDRQERHYFEAYTLSFMLSRVVTSIATRGSRPATPACPSEFAASPKLNKLVSI